MDFRLNISLETCQIGQKWSNDSIKIDGIQGKRFPYLLSYQSIITDDEVIEALDTVIRFMYQQNTTKILYDLEKRNKALAPPQEMTIKEIEKELGYKVKIINE